MKRQILRVIVAVVAVVVILSGCIPGNTQPSNTAQPVVTESSQPTQAAVQTAQTQNENVKISLWSWQPELEDAWKTVLIPGFEAANPGITVDYQVIPWGDYWQKVQTSIAANAGLPDVLNMSVAYVDVYAKQGILTDLHPYVQKNLDMTKYFDKAFMSVRYPSVETGDEYAMPWDLAENALFYNKTMFDAAGVAYPTDTWTWDDLRAAAKKLTNITDKVETTKWGFCSSTDYTFFDSVIYSFGGRVISADISHCMLNEPEAVQATQFMVDLVLKDQVSPKPGVLKQGLDSAFQTGVVGMEVSGAWVMDALKTSSDFSWGIAPIPMGPKGRFVRAWSDSMVIPQQSTHKDEAWKFIQYLTGENGQKLVNLQTRIPVIKSEAESQDWLENGKSVIDKSLLIKYLPDSSPLDFRGGWGEWVGALSNNVDPAFMGDKSVKDALDAATAAINPILESNK